MANEVQIEITVEEKQALAALAKLTRTTDDTAKKTVSNFNRMNAAFSSFAGNLAANAVTAGFRAIGAAAGALFDVFKNGIAGASQQEDAINKLNIALKASGQFTEETSKDFQKFASSLQETTKFGDEVILQNAALLQSIGRLSNDGLKQATKASLDLASGLGIDLQSAVTLVGKAAAGETGSLSRYGIIIEQGGDKAEKFAKALAKISENFGGAAIGQIKTYSGAVVQAKNSYGDLGEVLGKFLTENKLVISAINGASKAFVFLQGFLKSNEKAVQQFIENGVLAIVNALPAAARVIIGFNNVLVNTQTFFNFLSDQIIGVGASFTDLALSINGAAIAATGFLGLDTSNLEKIRGQLERQKESIEQARIINDKEASEKIANQEAFASTMTEVTGKVVNLLNTEIQKSKESAEATKQSNMSKVESEAEKIELLAALKEEERLVAEEQRLLEEVTASENNQIALENLKQNLAQQAAVKKGFSDKDKEIADKIRKQREDNTKKITENEKNSFKSIFDFERNVSKDRVSNFKSSLNTISTLQASSNSAAFAVGKAAALSTATVDGIAAVQKALASAPPPFNFAIAAAVGVAVAANIAKIASSKPPAYAQGGFVNSGNAVGDTNLIRVNRDEFVANKSQQQNILSAIASGASPSSDNSGAISRLIDAITLQPIIVQVDGNEIARATRNAVRDGFAIA